MPTPTPPSSPPGNIPEKLLARLWQKRAARQKEFRTGGGRRVKVLYPGRAGSSAGPDFRNALLEVEGLGLVQGDVEIHVRQQDWYAHGHAQDPNYNGVVLHAALEVSPQVTHLQSGHQAPVISLAGLLASADDPEAELNPEEGPAGEGLWAILESRGWGRPADAARLGELLDAAGDARFQARSAGFGALLAFLPGQPAGQTLYEGLMEALGYRANRQPFLKLAHRAPYALLAREALAYPSAERTGVIEDRLLKLAGLPGEKDIRQGGTIPRASAGYGSQGYVWGFQAAWRVTSRLGLGSGQGSGRSQTRLQRRPRSSNRRSQSMPWRITLTRPGLRQGQRCWDGRALGGVRRLPGAILRSLASSTLVP